MKKIVKFFIPGEPFGKQRARHRGRITYTPAKTHQYEDMVRYIATKEVKDLEGPIRVEIKMFYGVPKSWSKKKTLAALTGKIRPMKKPDKDNVEKVIYDGLNPKLRLNKALHKQVKLVPGLYLDDKQVVEGSEAKYYSDNPHVEVTVKEL